MKSYLRLKKIIIVFFAVQILFSLLNPKFSNVTNSFYPLYSWRLFNKIHNRVKDYSILISEVNGVKLEREISYNEILKSETYKKFSQPKRMIDLMGRYFEINNTKKFEEIRLVFEEQFFQSYKQITYTLVKRLWDPVEMWRNRPRDVSKKLAVIGKFEFSR